MADTGSGGFQAQARAAADGGDAGPSIGPGKGPTDRRDMIIAVAAIVAVVGGVVALVAL